MTIFIGQITRYMHPSVENSRCGMTGRDIQKINLRVGSRIFIL